MLKTPLLWRSGRCERCQYQDVQHRWHGMRLCDDCLRDSQLPPPWPGDLTACEPLPRDSRGRFRSRKAPTATVEVEPETVLEGGDEHRANGALRR
jgi:hypothetical protein